jgi:Nuclease-related domain
VRQLLDLRDLLFAEIGYIFLLLLPPAAWLWSLHRKQKKEKAELQMPFSDLQRRPAGESNRLRIEQFNEEIDPWLMAIAFVPVLLAFVLTLQKPNLVLVILFFLASAILCLVVDRKLRPLIKKRAAYRLGFQGERFVAEELNRLMADGFHVFHDLPFDNYNMDHVLVGPNGVFVVETKTRRKRAADGKDNYKVLFDGVRLNFPGSSATADRITAQPILTIPGWYVERSAPSDVFVTNPKQIRGFVLSSKDHPLTPAEIQRAVHQLEEKCKLAVD